MILKSFRKRAPALAILVQARCSGAQWAVGRQYGDRDPRGLSPGQAMTCAGSRAHLLLSAARSRLEGLGPVEGALLPPQHEVLRYGGASWQAQVLLMQGWSPVGIKDSLMLWKQELGENHRGVCTWEQHFEERRGAPDAWVGAALWSSEFSGWLACVAMLGSRSRELGRATFHLTAEFFTSLPVQHHCGAWVPMSLLLQACQYRKLWEVCWGTGALAGALG